MHEKYFDFRENMKRHDCYCSCNPAVRSFLKSWINEYLELFGKIRLFHLGGDEAYEFGTCPCCKNYAGKHGRNKLYSEFINDIAQPILERGIRPGIWGDMIMKYPDDLDEISRDFVIWDWNYLASDTSEKALIWGKGMVSKRNLSDEMIKQFPTLIKPDGNINALYACDFIKSMGYDVILCSSSRSSGDSNYCGRHSVHAPNIVACAHKTVNAELLGNCVTSWAIRLHSLESQEQWIYLAPMAMMEPEKTYNELLADLGQKLFGRDSEKFFRAIDLIGTPYPFNTSQEAGIQWNGLKDSLPAPKNYVLDCIQKIKNKNNSHWTDIERALKNTLGKILKGHSLLNEFSSEAGRGHSYIRQWQIIAQWQLQHLAVSQAVVDKANGRNMHDNNLIKMFIKQKKQFKQNSEKSQMLLSAAKNTNLLFDALLEYLQY